MKNTICEKLMWSAMTPSIFKYIAAHCKNTDTSRVKKKSRKNFKDMLARTPDIGSFTKNPLRICLSGGIVWMAVYKSMDGEMSHEQFGEFLSISWAACCTGQAHLQRAQKSVIFMYVKGALNGIKKENMDSN